jgi:hypothetical protein
MRRLVALGTAALEGAGRRADARELERLAAASDPGLLEAPKNG